jgi:hypothetical protein
MAEEANIQLKLLSKGSTNKHVSTVKMGYNNNGKLNRHERNSGAAKEERCFLRGPCQDVISGTVGESQFS